MNRPMLSSIRQTFGLILLTLAVAVVPARSEQDPALAAQRLADHALHGDFAGVLQLLESQPPAHITPASRELAFEIRRYQEHTQAHAVAKQEAFDQALAKVSTEFAAGKVEEALIAAIEAHSLAEDPHALLETPAVLKVVVEAKQQALGAERTGDWVEALNLYRELDLLFDDYRTYREPVKRTAKHVRVLQLYAPQALEALYLRRAKARGDQEPTRIEPEAWQVKLRDIELPMLRQALAQAARDHVNDAGYLPLVQGAVRSLRILLNTDALTDTFPGFRDQDKLTSTIFPR